MNKIVGIYSITSPTGKVYVGQSWNVENRFSQYKGLFCEDQPAIYNSLLKHGPDKHTFTIELELNENYCSQSVLDFWEEYYMDFYRSKGVELLNLREAGSRGKSSDETRKKISETRKKKIESGELIPHALGKPRSEETKQKLRDTYKQKYSDGYVNPRKNKKSSEEHIQKITESLKKRYEDHPEEREKIGKRFRDAFASGELTPSMFGKTHSEETRKKISKAVKGIRRTEEQNIHHSKLMKHLYASGQLVNPNLGKKLSKERCEQMSKMRKGIKLEEKTKILMRLGSKRNKRVLCVETGQEFISTRECIRQMFDGKGHSHVSAVCRGELPHHKGFTFKYI